MKVRSKLRCPECGEDYIHFYKLDVLYNENDTNEVRRYEFTNFERNYGTVAQPVEPKASEKHGYRGGGYEVTYHCECCHYFWKEGFFFTKGNIHTHRDGIPDTEVLK
jgi:hypothetical protein